MLGFILLVRREHHFCLRHTCQTLTAAWLTIKPTWLRSSTTKHFNLQRLHERTKVYFRILILLRHGVKASRRHVSLLVPVQFPFAGRSSSKQLHRPFWLQNLLFSSALVRTTTCRLMCSHLSPSDDAMRFQATLQAMEPEGSPHAVLSMLNAKSKQHRIIEICTCKFQTGFSELWFVY